VEIIKPKGNKQGGENPHMPKPEEHGGMPQPWHCPRAKHLEDMSPKYHEKQHKNVSEILAAHLPTKYRKGTKHIDERNVACGHNYQNAINKSMQNPCQGSDKLPGMDVALVDECLMYILLPG
jgi:hypothetical protein